MRSVDHFTPDLGGVPPGAVGQGQPPRSADDDDIQGLRLFHSAASPAGRAWVSYTRTTSCVRSGASSRCSDGYRMSLVDRHLRRAHRKTGGLGDEGARLRHSKVRTQSRDVDPMFEEHEPERVLGVTVDRVQETP